MGEFKQKVKWQQDGMVRALAIMRKTPNLANNLKELQYEIKLRRMVEIPMQVRKEFITDSLCLTLEKILSTYPVVMAKVLNESFGFGGQRLTRYMEEFHNTVESINNVDTFGDSYCTFSDYAKELSAKYKKDGLDLAMATIYKIDAMNEAAKDRRIEVNAMLDWLYEHGHVDAAVDFQKFMGIDLENFKEG